MSQKTKATATVLPPGSIAPVTSLKPGRQSIHIINVVKAHPTLDEQGNEIEQPADVIAAQMASPRSYVEVEYPDGWRKEHHALDADPIDLVEKIVNVLRARYGVEGVSIMSVPGSLQIGATIEVEI